MLPTSPSNKPKYQSRNKFNASAKPMDLQNVPDMNNSLTIISMEISEHGKSSGVLLLQTNYGALVLKANNETPQDFFFNELGLTLGVNAPVMDAIACYEQQFQNLVYAIEKYSFEDEVLYARLKTKLDFPFYEIMQFVPSISLAQIGTDKFKTNMLNDQKLYSLGMCAAFDIIINNNDRLGLVWRGQGNTNNILIEIPPQLRPIQLEKARDREQLSIKLGDYVFIDHDGHMLNKDEKIAADNIDKYMGKVTQFQLNMIMYLRKQYTHLPPQFDKLTKQIQFFTRYRLTENQLIKICEGIVYCTYKFIKLWEAKEVQALYEAMVKPVNTKVKEQNYWNDHWNRELAKVNLSFAETYYIKVSAIYTTYPELIEAIVEKVKNKMEEYLRNRRKRVSLINSRPASQRSNIHGSEQGSGQKDGEKGENDQPVEEDSEGMSRRQRKWRDKLEVFKAENYK